MSWAVGLGEFFWMILAQRSCCFLSLLDYECLLNDWVGS